jgi:tetratricopeptide (TPR) repeat protein
VADSPRIEELKRRVQSDPASIAFAALAEEYRRAGRFDEAIETCHTGLVRHPSYLSAHVTLGRALIEVGRLQDARGELEYVLKLAPENLAAIRGLAEIHHRIGSEGGDTMPDAVEDAVPLRVRVDDAPAVQAPEPVVSDLPAAMETVAASEPPPALPVAVDPSVAGLESFLNAIVRARAERAGAR